MSTKRSHVPVGSKARIFVVDDHPLVRKGLADLIGEEAGLEVCGAAGSAAEALAAVLRSKPDLVLVDISLPGRDGIELIKDLKAQAPHLRMLAVSMHEESLYAERALRAGARGYVMKSAPTEQLIGSIRKVLAGEVAVGAAVVNQSLASLIGGSQAKPATGLATLSDRELEIYWLIGAGESRKSIAAQLHLSPKTVETHRANIRQKLGLRDAAHLLQHATVHSRAGGAE